MARDIDRRTGEKLKRGQFEIDGRIDLHGMTQDKAQTSLGAFILRSYAANKRCLLIITGKGEKGRGVLKQRLPEWLNDPELSGAVLRIVPATPKDGGSGAFYVLLRRRR